MTMIWTKDACINTYPAGYWIPGGRRSGTMKETELTIQGTNKTLKVPMRMCTTVWEVAEMLAKRLDKAPDELSFVVKRGCSYAKLMPSDQMQGKVLVTGIKSWEREHQSFKHPIAIIGAGHTGLRQALEFVKLQVEDFVVFERWDRIGGDAWLKQANSTSKLQTELGTYHLQFDECYPVPHGIPTYPQRDRVLQHFEEVAEDLGIMPHVRLCTRVAAMDKPFKVMVAQPDRSYTLHLVPQPQGEYVDPQALEVAKHSSADVERFSAAAVFMFPGNLTLAKKVVYKGEDSFEGTIGYGMFDAFDCAKLRAKDVAIVGMGAFSVENLRTCLEQGANKVYLIVRRKNLVMPRAISWFINQGVQPAGASSILRKLEGAYALAEDDPWSYYAVTASQDRSKARICQAARFPISDIYFLACYYNRAEVVCGQVKRLLPTQVALESCAKLEVQCLIKVFGFHGSTAVDKLMHVEEMLTYWVNSDGRRWIWSESPGVDFSRIGGTTLSPGISFFSHIAAHYLLFPRDFGELLRSGLVPRFRQAPGSLHPAYVLSARDATAAQLALSQVSHFADRNVGLIKRARQRACHPLEDYLDELQAEWDDYCELLRPEGSDAENPEYLFTVLELKKMIELNDAGAF